MNRRIWPALPLVLTTALPLAAGAADTDRAQRWEATIQGRFVGSEDIGFTNGARARVDSSTGFGLGFAYNLDNRFAVGFDFGWNELDYTGTATSTGGASNGIRGRAYTTSGVLTGTWHLLEGPVTPYLSANIGMNYTDSGIPQGVTSGCWWYPWYGYVCGPVTYNRTSTDWTYGLGAGLRWDVTGGLFLKGGIQQQWIPAGAASGTPSFTIGRFDVGFKF